MDKLLFILLLGLFNFPFLSKGQHAAPQTQLQNTDTLYTSMDVAMDFIYDLADEDVSLDSMVNDYVLAQHVDDEMYDYLIASLQEIRLNLMSKNLDEIRFIPYHEMPRKEVSDIDIEDRDVNNMFFLYYGKRQVTALLIDGDMIASFSLVSKGNNKAHFVTY